MKNRIKEFYEEHKLFIGYAAGGLTVLATVVLANRIEAIALDKRGFKTVRPVGLDTDGERLFEELRGNTFIVKSRA